MSCPISDAHTFATAFDSFIYLIMHFIQSIDMWVSALQTNKKTERKQLKYVNSSVR